MRTPKDINKYIPSLVAGVRLVDLAMKHVLCRRDARVKWQLKLQIYYPEGSLKNSTAVAVPVSGTFSSGDFDEPTSSEQVEGRAPSEPSLKDAS